jgi:hypothetical protein
VTVGTEWLPLPQPRSLNGAEQAVLDRLVTHTGSAELAAQASSAQVTAVCGCGCGSIRLHTDAPPLSPEAMTQLSSTGRDDWFSVDSTRIDETTEVGGSRIEVRMFQVVLHVVQGSLHELEIFAGEGVAVEPPPPDELTDLSLN